MTVESKQRELDRRITRLEREWDDGTAAIEAMQRNVRQQQLVLGMIDDMVQALQEAIEWLMQQFPAGE